MPFLKSDSELFTCEILATLIPSKLVILNDDIVKNDMFIKRYQLKILYYN